MTLSDEDIVLLYRSAEHSEHAARDQLLVRAALYWGFTPTELSLLAVEQVMTVDGQWREQFVLPASFAFNGLSRSAWIRDARLIPYLDEWVCCRQQREWGMAFTGRYRSLEGQSPLLLNNQGRPYAMTPRRPGAEDLLPSGMHRQLRELLDRAGLEQYSPQVFRDTYIVRLWQRGLSRQQIARLTGISKLETITRKIRHLMQEPEAVFVEFLP